MRFKDYVNACQALLAEQPQTADMDVVASSDDEGNRFNPVYYVPSILVLEGEEADEQSETVVCVN